MAFTGKIEDGDTMDYGDDMETPEDPKFPDHGMMGKDAPPGVVVPFSGGYLPPEYANLVDMMATQKKPHPHESPNRTPKHQSMFAPEPEDEDKLPGDGVPGFSYMNHLFRRGLKKGKEAQMKQRLEQAARMAQDGLNIYTDHEEALKAAVGILGLYSDKNPGGMPIPIERVRSFWFKGEEPDPRDEAEWRSLIENGDRNLDPKRIRKFVNYDGSMTFEILNQDKTVMSRFTMGNVKDQFLFTQGGYTKFATLLEKFKKERGPDIMEGFDSIRAQFGG